MESLTFPVNSTLSVSTILTENTCYEGKKHFVMCALPVTQHLIFFLLWITAVY